MLVMTPGARPPGACREYVGSGKDVAAADAISQFVLWSTSNWINISLFGER